MNGIAVGQMAKLVVASGPYRLRTLKERLQEVRHDILFNLNIALRESLGYGLSYSAP